MISRSSKMILVLAMSFFCSLTVFGNISDAMTNFHGVVGVLEMKQIFPTSTIAYRAIMNPNLHHAAFVIIISFEALTGLLCLIGAIKMFRARNENAKAFNLSKNWAIAGLTLGFLTWQVLFMSIGGEWFGMWMSQMFNGALTTAFHIFITMLVVLIYVVQKDE